MQSWDDRKNVKPNIVAFIFARGGSKGIPRKNVRMLYGKPLIAYSIEVAHQSEFIDQVIVSTDDAEVAEIAREYGAEVPFIRPEELAGDHVPERAAWQHALKTLASMESSSSIDIFVCIPPTSPLRTVADLDACINAFIDDDVDIVITVTPAARSPYYNMVVLDERDHARLVISPDRKRHARQDTPPVYDMTTVAYVARPEHVLEADYIFDGKVKAVIVPKERSIDLDTELDWLFSEFLLARGNKDDVRCVQ